MKGKELFNVLLLCCCLLILSGSFLPYISVNFPDTNAGWGARSVIQEQLPEMFEEDGTFQAAAVDLISDMQTKNKLGMVKWWFIVTLFLNLVCVLSLLMENNGISRHFENMQKNSKDFFCGFWYNERKAKGGIP